ncbi:MAG: hypothetical protein PF638_11180 [Candidatus Delongbacteria bacterium]|jgi:hypothetical protein|nr:hypothetical protein [Candidatus Delongbacteria bacterium]
MSVPSEVLWVMEQMGIATYKKFLQLMKGGDSAELIGNQLEKYRAGDRGDANKQSVQSGSDGGVRPTNQTEKQSFAGSIPVEQTQQGNNGRPQDIADTPNSFAGSSEVSADTRNELSPEDYKRLHSNQYAGEYNTPARIEAVFKTKDGLMSNSLIDEYTPDMLKENYFAATGKPFEGSDEEIFAEMKKLRDTVKQTK